MDKYWEKVDGYVTENEVDVRWILREPNNTKAFGSLRIVSHPDCKPGFLKSFASFVINRRPKSREEIEATIVEFDMEEKELELYTVDEHIETTEIEHEDRFQELQKRYGVKIFE